MKCQSTSFGAFDASMKSGNFQRAAGLFDFEEHERNINPAFDSLPIGGTRDEDKDFERSEGQSVGRVGI